jgi:hypothetical protein
MVRLFNQPTTRDEQKPEFAQVPQMGQDSQNVQMPDQSYEGDPGFYNEDQQQGYQRGGDSYY